MDKLVSSNFFSRLSNSLKVLTGISGVKDDTYNGISLVQTYESDAGDIENVEDYYKLITEIAAIPKSIDEISAPIFSAGYTIKDKTKDIEIQNIPPVLELLIDQPHYDYNFDEFVILIITDLLISGNIFVYLVKDGRQTWMRRVDPRYVQYTKDGWTEDNPNGVREILDERYLIHVKYQPDVFTPKWGRGIVANNIALFRDALQKLEFSKNFFENGCHPTAVIAIENGGQVGALQFKRELDEKKGSKGAGEPVIIDGKATWHQIQLDPETMKMSDNLMIVFKQIMSAFGLPKYLMDAGTKEGQKFNNHALQKEHFIKSTIIPVASKIESVFNKVVQQLNPNWEFKFNINSEVYDPVTLQAMYAEGEITANEHRKLLNLSEGEDKNLDVFLVPSGKKPLEKVIEGEPIPELPALPPAVPADPLPPKKPAIEDVEPVKPKKPKKKIDNSKVRSKSWRDNDYLSQPEGDVWTVDEIKAQVNQKRIGQDFSNLNKKTRLKKTKEANLKLQMYLIDTYSLILANVAKHSSEIEALSKPGKADSDISNLVNDIYNDAGDLVKLEAVTSTIFQSVGAATYANTANILTVNLPFPGIDKRDSKKSVAQKINLMRENGPLMIQTVKDRVQKDLVDGINAGKTHTEIAKDIWNRNVSDDNELTKEFQTIYRKGVKPKDFDEVMTKGNKLQNRALLIARTEVANANKLFSAESMKASGVVKSITIIDCDPCPICAPHQNVPVSFDEADRISTLHPNCTGSVVPSEISSD